MQYNTTHTYVVHTSMPLIWLLWLPRCHLLSRVSRTGRAVISLLAVGWWRRPPEGCSFLSRYQDTIRNAVDAIDVSDSHAVGSSNATDLVMTEPYFDMSSHNQSIPDWLLWRWNSHNARCRDTSNHCMYITTTNDEIRFGFNQPEATGSSSSYYVSINSPYLLTIVCTILLATNRPAHSKRLPSNSWLGDKPPNHCAHPW